MSLSSISNEGLSTLLPNSSDEDKILRRSARRRRKSYWLQPSSDNEPESVIETKFSPPATSPHDNESIGSNFRIDTESPVSHNKKTRRRSPRRRSIAVHDGSLLLSSSNTEPSNISSLSSMSNNCDEQVDMVTIHSSKVRDNISDVDETNVRIEMQVDESLSNREGGNLRRSTRRRSLAIHNGSLLLGNSCNINSDISSSAPSGHKKSDIPAGLVSTNHHVSMPSKNYKRNDDKESVQQSPSIFSKVCKDVTNATLSDEESSKNQPSKKSSPVSITGEIEGCQSHPVVSSDMIKSTMKHYFGVSTSDTKPYVTPRLFACVICLLEQQHSSLESNHPFIQLLKAYVGAEVASLRDLDMNTEPSAKKIHFCSYDMSSIISPIDTVEDSNLIVENCIDALNHVVEVINSVRYMKNDSFKDLLDLSVRLLGRIHNNDELLALSCAKAMPWNWPVARIAKAAMVFMTEFNSISNTITTDSNDKSTSLHLLARKSLGDLIGRAVKFYLRRFFNPVPLPLYSDSNNLPDYSNSRSKIHALIELKDPEGDGQRDTATADGCISSVFGTALQKISAFISLNEKLRNGGEKYFTNFCCRAATKRGLKVKDRVIRLTNDDITDVLIDIEESHIFLAGIRASKFMHSLLSWPGIADAIQDVGGWEKVESLASLFQSLGLTIEMPEETHLILLRNVNDLKNSYESNKKELDELEVNVVESLRKVWKQFKCGSRNQELFEMNPCIKQFQIELKSGKNTRFPIIVNASLE